MGELLQFVKNRPHFEDGIIAALRRRAVAAYPLNIDANLHTPALAAIDLAIRRLGTDHEFRANAGLFDDVLPAQTVTIFLLDGTGHQQGIFIFQTEVLDDFPSVDHRRHPAFLVGRAAPADQLIGFHPLIGVEGPVLDVTDANGINMRVHGDQSRAVADIAQHVAHRVNLDFIEADFFHFFFNTMHDAFFVTAFAGDSDHIAQEAGHILLVVVCFFDNQFERNVFSHELTLRSWFPASRDEYVE